ncbi:MAG: nucleotidyltransferase family protein [Candidatus Woesearchaeota archaeon]|nr:nucleotidyltransferase family protein [Candidatus Woesearchaeota archaeon]
MVGKDAKMGIRKAVILAGGQGTRLRPITYKIPKALVRVHGRTTIEHLLDLLKSYGIQDIILAVGYLKEMIKENFKDGSAYGVNIKYIVEEFPLGTAGPLYLAKKDLNQTFIVTNGDELKNIEIDKMYSLHKRKKALITIALTAVEDVSNYGVARIDSKDKDRIIEFIEKPKKEDAPSNLISAGFYIIEPKVLEFINEGFSMLEKDVFPKIANLKKLYGYRFKGQFYDIGTIEKYKKAIKEWKDIKT